MNSWERRVATERGVSRLLRLARDASNDTLSPSEQRGLLRLEAALARERGRERRPAEVRWRGRAVVAALAMAAALVLALFAKHRSSAPTFEVANGSVSSAGYIQPTAPEGARIRFADGTEVVLESGARTKVAEVYAEGARVLLEQGKARMHVVPRREAKWSIEAGPYTIQVTGTVFDVAWLGHEESLDLWLREGSVVVTGPLTSRGFVVRAGQHLIARVREGLLLLDGQPLEDFRLGRAEPSGETPSAELPVAATASGPKNGRSESVRPNGRAQNLSLGDEARAASWSKRLAQGDFDGILTDADRKGLQAVLSKAPRAELVALADAARYVRRFDVARRALLAQRERFPGSVESHEAAFFLGGLAETDTAATGSALDWYERYLAESPHGSYASQALGRKMMIVHRLRGRDAAKVLALEYLKQFPQGPYARHAKNLLETNATK